MDLQHDRVNLMSNESVILDKLYGPLIFADIRCTPDTQTCEWVIERKAIGSGFWTEIIRIPGQVEEDF